MKRLILQEKAWGSDRKMRDGFEEEVKEAREGKPR